jgi:hypothetical protein
MSLSRTWSEMLQLVSTHELVSVAARASRRSSSFAASSFAVPPWVSWEPKSAASPSFPFGSR